MLLLGKPKLFSLLDLAQIPFIFALTRYFCSVHNHTLFYKLCSWNRYMYLVRVFGKPFTEVSLMCGYFLLRNMVMVPLFQSLHLMQKLIVNCYGRPWEEQVSFQLFILYKRDHLFTNLSLSSSSYQFCALYVKHFL